VIVCIDTNVVVQATASSHPHHTILNAWLAGQFTWAVSTPILLEYEEIHLRLGRADRWQKFVRLLDLAEMTSGNLLRVNPSFRFHIVTVDPDDNIFTDCAIAAGADWLITDDVHFEPLVGAGYKPQPIAPVEFTARFLNLG
jgi:putative PIN family toxin of toxin-antitoxin system